jgi:hypothetical protein
MTKGQSLVAATVVVLLCLGTASTAARGDTVKGNGHSVFVPQTTESYQLPDGRTVERNFNAGFLVASQPDNPLNLNTHKCTGTTVISADGKSQVGGGHCVSVDSDGDFSWLWWRGDQAGGTWGYLGGTGKFDGVKGGGTWKSGQTWADGQYINTYEGTWEMK